MLEHSILAPSSAYQWANCAGSIKAQADIPNTDSEESREGTAAHWVGSEVLSKGESDCFAYVGRTAPNGVVIDEKMAEGAQAFVDTVSSVVSNISNKLGRNMWPELLVEQRVHANAIHPELWGTLDAALYVPELGYLFVWDYKHGHSEVRAERNEQLICYTAGLVEYYSIDGTTDQSTQVFMSVVQPFCYQATAPTNEWRTILSDLRSEFNRLEAAAIAALGGSPTLTTGAHCRHCRAISTCSAVRKAAYNLIDVVNVPYDMDSMNGADLAKERAILSEGLKVAKSRLEAIEDELKHRIQNGDSSTGLSLETTAGRLNWSIPVDNAVLLGQQFNVDISKPGVLTPTQAKAKVPKDLRPHFIKVLKSATERKAGSLKLVDAENSIGARAFGGKSNATI